MKRGNSTNVTSILYVLPVTGMGLSPAELNSPGRRRGRDTTGRCRLIQCVRRFSRGSRRVLQGPRGLCAISTRSAKCTSHLCQDMRHEGGHELAVRSAALSIYHGQDLSKHPRYKPSRHLDNPHVFGRSRPRAGQLRREKAKPMQIRQQIKSHEFLSARRAPLSLRRNRTELCGVHPKEVNLSPPPLDATL